MGSQQSKNEKKFKRFWKKFLAAVVEINSRRKEEFAIEIELANGDSIGLTKEILVQKFPGCIHTNWYSGRHVFLWTNELFYADGRLCPFSISGLPDKSMFYTFWELKRDRVRDFYNGVV